MEHRRPGRTRRGARVTGRFAGERPGTPRRRPGRPGAAPAARAEAVVAVRAVDDTHVRPASMSASTTTAGSPERRTP